MENKIYPNNNFIIDVFELLDLDFEEYVNKGIMSYANLIANKHQSSNKQQQLKKISEDGILTDQNSNCEKTEEIGDDFNEKDENFPSHKKGSF